MALYPHRTEVKFMNLAYIINWVGWVEICLEDKPLCENSLQ